MAVMDMTKVERGETIRPFRLPSHRGEVRTRDFRQRRNLVLVFQHADCPACEATLRALDRLARREGPGAARSLSATDECREAVARVGRPTFLFAYRRAWRSEDYAPIMALLPALSGVLYGAAFAGGAPPELVELLGTINIPAMPSTGLLARHSIPSVLVGRAGPDGVSVTGWGPGLYPGGLASPEAAILAAPPVAAVLVTSKAVRGRLGRAIRRRAPGRGEPPVEPEPVEVEW